MGPCLCGDTQCSSCGPAQGNYRCTNCGKWTEDGKCTEECLKEQERIDEEAARAYAEYDQADGYWDV